MDSFTDSRPKHDHPRSDQAGPAPVRRKPSPLGLKVQHRPIPGVRHIIAVASGKGGVGKSTVSVNLAGALSKQGQRVGLLDADIYGPSAPTMLGIEGGMDVRDRKLIPRESHGMKVVSFGFLMEESSPVIWRGPMVAKALHQLFYDVAWGELDYLVIDLPPGTGDVQLTILENLPVTGAVLVSTPQDVALIDVKKAHTMFQKLQVPITAFIENMSLFTCPHCGESSEILGHGGALEWAMEQGIPNLSRIPLHKDIRLKGDGGSPIVFEKDNEIGAVFNDAAADIINSEVL